MAKIYEMPELAESVVEGEIVRWIKKAGEHVTMDEPFVEIMTEKVTVEIPAPFTGTLLRTMGNEGDVLAVGAPLAVFGEPNEDAEAALAAHVPEGHGHTGPPAAKKAPEPASVSTATASDGAPPASVPSANGHPTAKPQPVQREGRALAAPAVRRFAREAGVDLAFVAGSGPNGRIRREDIEKNRAGDGRHAAGTEDAAHAASLLANAHRDDRDRRIPLVGLRRVIAQRMPKSKQTAAHTLNVDEADMTRIAEMRTRLKPLAAEQGVKLTYLPFIVKAAAVALASHPYVNSSLDDAAHEIVLHNAVNIGIAVDVEDGLTVPVIHDVARKTIMDVAREISRLADLARNGKLGTGDISGGTFTVTNQGSVGGLFTMPVINLPEAAILGVHVIKERPVVRDGAVVPRLMTYFSLSFDHRLVDGAEAARFTNDLIRLVENPELLLVSI